MSGSAAKEVKFWEWAIIEQEGNQARQLTVSHTRTLEMTDDVLCVRISPNGAPAVYFAHANILVHLEMCPCAFSNVPVITLLS